VMGNVAAIGNAAGANPATETYSYDPLYRLTTVTEANGTVLEGVTYNQTGDRLTKTGSGLDTGAYGYNPNTHQLVSVGNSALSVDANGNTTAMTQAGSTYGFGYSARNRMVVAQLAGSTVGSYTYNALNQRVQKIANGTTERYGYNEGSQILDEYGAMNRDYIWMDAIPVANVDTSGTTSAIAYVTADHLGTPRAIVDVNSNTLWQRAYQGNPWNEQAPTSNGYVYNLGFPGQYFDAETGLSNNVNRDYDSSTGRYVESDPIGLVGGANTYAYVNGDPLNYADSLGLAQCTLVFSGGKGYMQCVPDNPDNSPVGIPVASGNNGGGMDCKNNPECQDLVGQGPIPSGCWQWTNGYTGKPNGRVLQPCPGWPDHGRSNIRSHSCLNAFGPSKVPPFCSDGCVTGSAGDIQSLNNLLDSEPNSTLWVGSPAIPQIPSFDNSLPGKTQ
jgi:RHS repeat-associated protein